MYRPGPRGDGCDQGGDDGGRAADRRGLLFGRVRRQWLFHVVDKPQADVVAALEDLDITAKPGNPGTDPSRSGGVLPNIRLEKAADHMIWWVMSGQQVAIQMTAHFEPIDGGKRTRVTNSVARGDAPDDRVSPAFRSTGITSGLFSMAVEGELDKLTAPPRASAETCRALIDHLTEVNMADPAMHDRPADLRQAFGQGAKQIMRLNQMHDALRNAGCPVDGNGGAFKDVSEEMKPADTDQPIPRATPTADTAGDGIPDD